MQVFNYKGVWHISNNVHIDNLTLFIKELMKDKDYIGLSIRKTKENNYQVDFEYHNPKGFSYPIFSEYLQSTIKLFKDRFGIDFIGYDVSNLYRKIK